MEPSEKEPETFTTNEIKEFMWIHNKILNKRFASKYRWRLYFTACWSIQMYLMTIAAMGPIAATIVTGFGNMLLWTVWDSTWTTINIWAEKQSQKGEQEDERDDSEP